MTFSHFSMYFASYLKEEKNNKKIVIITGSYSFTAILLWRFQHLTGNTARTENYFIIVQCNLDDL